MSISANDNVNVAAAAGISSAATHLCENSNNFANTIRSAQKVLSKLGYTSDIAVILAAANAVYSDYKRAATAEDIARHIIQDSDENENDSRDIIIGTPHGVIVSEEYAHNFFIANRNNLRFLICVLEELLSKGCWCTASDVYFAIQHGVEHIPIDTAVLSHGNNNDEPNQNQINLAGISTQDVIDWIIGHGNVLLKKTVTAFTACQNYVDGLRKTARNYKDNYHDLVLAAATPEVRHMICVFLFLLYAPYMYAAYL